MIYNVLQYLEKNAYEQPDRVALVDDDESVTYRQYMEYARHIGAYIAGYGDKADSIGTGRPIAVLIDRNIRTIYTFMGIVYSGNFYVPIDPTMPEERVGLILSTLKPALVLNATDSVDEKYGSIAVTDILADASERGCADILRAIRDNMIDTDPLYTIFTSGSTGVPKGVCVAHRSMLDLVSSFEDAFSFDEGTVFGNQAPFDFDVSAKDIYNALYCCGTVRVIPKKYFKSPVMLVQFLNDSGIDTLIWAVSALRIISDFKALDKAEAPKLKNIMFSGEVMPVKALNYLREHITDARYVNLYGPTEITCNCTYYIVDRDFTLGEQLPVGKAFRNTRVLIRDEKGQIITTQNVIGEICVCGTCVSLGYWNNRPKTDEAYVQTCGITEYPDRMYATGDLGFYDANGDIVFASRKDSQIKHMGHRIELGEIEVALNALDMITIACCIYDNVNEKIICFYQSEEECKKEIVAELSKKLPKYMWPNVYRHYETLPLNKNGKIDRVALKKEI